MSGTRFPDELPRCESALFAVGGSQLIAGQDVLYLDYDSVLHPEPVYWSFKRGAFLDSDLVRKGHALFENCRLLEALLSPYPNLRIVLSTSWVRVYSYNKARSRLTLPLRERCIGSTFHSLMNRREFEEMPRGAQVLADVQRRRPRAWLAIDDDWDVTDESNLVRPHEVDGIASPNVLSALRYRLEEKFG